MSLVEKAAAKLYGSYEALVHGCIHEGMTLLSGAPTETIYLKVSPPCVARFLFDALTFPFRPFCRVHTTQIMLPLTLTSCGQRC